MAAGCLRLSAREGEEPPRQVICLSFRFGLQVAAPMPRFLIDYHCNGHTTQDCEGVELDSVEQAGAHALAAAPQVFNDLTPVRLQPPRLPHQLRPRCRSQRLRWTHPSASVLRMLR